MTLPPPEPVAVQAASPAPPASTAAARTARLRAGAARPAAGAALVAVGMAVANLLGYVLNLVASRQLGPAAYGALGALLGVVLVGNVPALALQTVVARRTAVARGASVASASLAYGLRVALAVLAAGVAVAAPLASWLHLGSVAAPLWVAATLFPLTLLGVQQGVLQGGERFSRLALLFVVAAAARVGGGLLALAAGGGVTAVVAGSAVGTWLAAVVGLALVHRRSPLGGAPLPEISRELLTAGQALLALFVLTNVDLLLARHYLPAAEAGLYAVGAVIAKGAFWLPQFVAVVAFPRLSDPQRHGAVVPRAVVAVVSIGAVVVAVTAVFGRLVVRVAAGSSYDALAGEAWLFAAIGSGYALCQLLLFSQLAGRRTRLGTLLWGVVAVEALLITSVAHGSVAQVAAVAFAASGALAVAGLALEVRRLELPARRPGSGDS